jgi:LPS sulfotransferase NodH
MTDAEPASSGNQAVKSYLICAIPRTGSYLLCDMLGATGVAGRPNEYFSGSYQAHWSKRWGVTDYDSYLRRVIQVGTTQNGIMGVKSHPWQFNHFARQAAGHAPVPYSERPAVLDRWFPDLHYVWLRRKDRLRQAISYARSLQTNIWWDADTEPVPNAKPKPEALEFDFDLITQSVARLVEEEDMWRRYFDANGIDPLVLYYEDLVIDPDSSVRSVFELLKVQLPSGLPARRPSFRPQADGTTASWLTRYRAELSRGPYAIWRTDEPRTTQAEPESTSGPPRQAAADTSAASAVHRTPTITNADLESALGSRRWLRCTTPFPYVRASNVFEETTYQSIAAQYEAILNSGQFSRAIAGYDVTAYTITKKTGGPLGIFSSRPWHDMLARLFGVDATGELNISLHHHAVGSQSGSPHNDLNPGWFPQGPHPDGLIVYDPADGYEYRHGSTNPDIHLIERVRGVAVIFYLANPIRFVGGGTGLYRSTSDPIDRPAAVVPPRNNSLVAFECTPSTFHGFMSNRRGVRNTLVMWLHRDKKEAVRRWGESSIVYW